MEIAIKHPQAPQKIMIEAIAEIIVFRGAQWRRQPDEVRGRRAAGALLIRGQNHAINHCGKSSALVGFFASFFFFSYKIAIFGSTNFS
jgi:hypothetical protein